MERLEKDWNVYPVFHIDFSLTKYTTLFDLQEQLNLFLLRCEKVYGAEKEEKTPAARLQGMIRRAYEQTGLPVVVLIDEYDVPMAKAHENGYYDDMVLLLRNMFGNVLKSNDSLAFAVLTGCLRIAKESIFTGLNNFKVYSITDQEFDETFGFTDAEVKAMLQYYGLQNYFDVVREWYDGYRFGKADVYCPWDVVNYCSDHRKNPDVEMKNYWMNTSGNEVIRHLLTV